jgi:cobalt-zinc-cadmium efflux system membrane fusion protein
LTSEIDAIGVKLLRRIQLTIIAAALLGGVMLYALWPPAKLFADQASDHAAAPEEQAPRGFTPTKETWAELETALVDTRQFRPENVTEGNIALDDDLSTPVYSPYSGRVVRLIAELGARVERGAPLFAVEANEFVQGANTLIAAVAADKTAHAQLSQAEINEKRAHDLYLANGGALKDWQQSRTDLAGAQNAVRTADIALTAVRNQLQILGKSAAEIAALETAPTQRLDPAAVVTAPIAGIVTQRQVSLGQYIQSIATGASNPVYTIGDLSKVYLIANVREADANSVRVGDAIEVRVPANPDRVFTAKLSWVGPAVDPNTHRLPVRAVLDNPDGALKPMMFATFTIVTGEPVTAPAVPQSAVIYEGRDARVWIVGEDGTLMLRPVKTGRTRDGMVEILSGLAGGEKIITKGAVFIDRAGGTS